MAEKSYKTKLKHITTLIFDIDGVLTDSTILVTTAGEMLRQMNTRDGFALRCAVDAGLKVCIISGGSNEGVRVRLEGLGLTDIILGSHNKIEDFTNLIKNLKVSTESVMYMGDDIPDLPVMTKVGLPCCPQDAAAEIKAVSEYISHKKGGQGAVRDIIEQILKVQNHWMKGFDAQFD